MWYRLKLRTMSDSALFEEQSYIMRTIDTCKSQAEFNARIRDLAAIQNELLNRGYTDDPG